MGNDGIKIPMCDPTLLCIVAKDFKALKVVSKS